MSGWDSGGGWQAEGGAKDPSANGNAWNGADGAEDSTWSGGNDIGAAGAWTSGDPAMAGDAADQATGKRGPIVCRNCNEPGHIARECPTKPANDGKCFSCGEVGHNKEECSNPRVQKCVLCKEEGHGSAECPNRGLSQNSAVASIDPEEAWANLRKADAALDLDDAREACMVYCKSVPGSTYADIEAGLRSHSMNLHLIGMEKELPNHLTLVNLAGEIDQKFEVRFQWSAKPKRVRAAAGWPSSYEENIERLKASGLAQERGIIKCMRCRELGHSWKNCPRERDEDLGRELIKCANCHADGHRARECTEERVDRFACRNCRQPGHKSSECTAPRNATTVECHNCGEKGHFSRDCPTGGKSITCRNCDKEGHISKECPKPRDHSRLQCQVCNQIGHTKVRCPEDNGEGDQADGQQEQPTTAQINEAWGNDTRINNAADSAWISSAPAAESTSSTAAVARW